MWRLRALGTTVAAAAATLSFTTPAVSAPAAGPALEIKSIAFDRAQVDVTQDYATVNLTWTMSGGEHDDGTGVFHLAVSTGRLEPGQYTIGFSLTDEAGNTSMWGYPNNAGNPIPSGPPVLTVTAG
ncbi:hypothetical protein Ate01nite_26040 [Actinoplanes teichomyceticus]|nr:hypothetical protein Ate01nite_26040 [Actinoplanes teichomyceticus]